jgi:hypothetical protein
MTLSAPEIAQAYLEWWTTSYPNSPPLPQTIVNVVAFVQHLQRRGERTDDLHR